MVQKIDLTKPITPLTPPAKSSAIKRNENGADFQALLAREMTNAQGVKFSQHAKDRLSDRQIQLTDHHIERLDAAVQMAASKGARDSLVLMDDLALVVSVQNRTVVTAVDSQHIREHVFTGIDSAVIA